MLSICVVSGSDLDDVSSDEVDAVETTQDGPELARRPPASLWGAGGRGDYGPWASVSPRSLVCDRDVVKLTSRIESVDVNTQVHGVLGPDSLPYSMSVISGRHEGVIAGHGLDALIFLMIPSMPMVSISRASTIWKPQ